MAGIQLTGLASGMDWKTTVEQLMKLERIPQDALKSRKAAQANKQAALDKVKSSVSSLSAAASALNVGTTSSAPRTAKMLSSTVSATGAALLKEGSVTTDDGAVAGTYQVEVTQSATPALLKGQDYKLLAQDLRDPSNTFTLGDYGVKEGQTLTVNGFPLEITSAHLGKTVEEFFEVDVRATSGDIDLQIEFTATGLTLKGNYSYTPSLGSPSDSGNVLGLLGISFEGLNTLASPVELKYSQKIPSAVLAAKPLSSLGVAVDATSEINGVSIAMSPSESLGSLVSKINSSAAGVTAYIDPIKRSLVLASNDSGGAPISVRDVPSPTPPLGLAHILGASTAVNSQPFKYALKRNGQWIENPLDPLDPANPPNPSDQATYSDQVTYVSRLSEFSSNASTLDLSVHGFGATSLSVPGVGSYKFQVDTVALSRDKIDSFIKAYNDLRTQVNDLTKTTVGSDGKVTNGVLAGNRDVQTLLSTIRTRIFSPVKDPGSVFANIDDAPVSGSYYGVGLDSIGIGFDRDGVLKVTSESKLTMALSQSPGKVNALFSSGSSSIEGTGTSGNTSVTVSSTSDLVNGQAVSGDGIPSGTTITLVPGSSTITLSKPLTKSISRSKIYLPVANQGVAVRLAGWLSSALSTSTSEPGLFKTASSTITSETKSIQTQIDAMERRIVARQKNMEASFIAMEKAQSRSQNMLSQLSNAFTK
jgi:flagellar capping protein FliD